MSLIITKIIVTVFTLVIFISTTGSFFKSKYKNNKLLVFISIFIAVISAFTTTHFVIDIAKNEIIRMLENDDEGYIGKDKEKEEKAKQELLDKEKEEKAKQELLDKEKEEKAKQELLDKEKEKEEKVKQELLDKKKEENTHNHNGRRHNHPLPIEGIQHIHTGMKKIEKTIDEGVVSTSLLEQANNLRMNVDNGSALIIKNLENIFTNSGYKIGKPEISIENENRSTVNFNVSFKINENKINNIFSKYGFVVNDKQWKRGYEDSTVISLPKYNKNDKKKKEFLINLMDKIIIKDFFIEFTTNKNKKKYMRLTYRHQFGYSGIYYISTDVNYNLKFKNITNNELNNFNIINSRIIYINPHDIGYS